MTTLKTIIITSVLLLGFISCSKNNDISIIDPTTSKTEQQKVFKEFWDIYDRHYPLMHRKNINWQTVYDT